MITNITPASIPTSSRWRRVFSSLLLLAAFVACLAFARSVRSAAAGNGTQVQPSQSSAPTIAAVVDRDVSAVEKQIIEKRGSWLNYKGTQLAQGRDAAKEVLKNDKPLYEEIEAAVKAKLDEDKS